MFFLLLSLRLLFLPQSTHFHFNPAYQHVSDGLSQATRSLLSIHKGANSHRSIDRSIHHCVLFAGSAQYKLNGPEYCQHGLLRSVAQEAVASARRRSFHHQSKKSILRTSVNESATWKILQTRKERASTLHHAKPFHIIFSFSLAHNLPVD